MKNNTIMVFKVAVLVSAVAMFPGCKFIGQVKEMFMGKKQEAHHEPMSDMMAVEKNEIQSDLMREDVSDSNVLAYFGKEPLVTVAQVESELERILQDPQVRALAPMVPDLKEKVAQGLIMQETIRKRVEEMADAEYAMALASALEQTKRQFDYQWFITKNPITASDKDIEMFYNANKEGISELIISRGGVSGVGVAFDSEKEANDFLRYVGNQNLAMVAEQEGIPVETFVDVGPGSSNVDSMVQNAFLEMTTFPSNKVVQSNGLYWVLQGQSKEKEMYQTFEESKEMLRPYVEKELQQKQIESLVEKYQNEYGLKINEKAMKLLAPDPQEMQNIQKQLQNMLAQQGGMNNMPEDMMDHDDMMDMPMQEQKEMTEEELVELERQLQHMMPQEGMEGDMPEGMMDHDDMMDMPMQGQKEMTEEELAQLAEQLQHMMPQESMEDDMMEEGSSN